MEKITLNGIEYIKADDIKDVLSAEKKDGMEY